MLNGTGIKGYTTSHIITNELIFIHMTLTSSYIKCLKHILGNEKL